VTIASPNDNPMKLARSAMPPWLGTRWLGVVALIAALTAMRMVYAGVMELRTDEAYYWTWSKESALSFLDHSPG
jgi:hypothetical protein